MPRPVLKPTGEGLWLPGYETGGGCLEYDLELFVRLADRSTQTHALERGDLKGGSPAVTTPSGSRLVRVAPYADRPIALIATYIATTHSELQVRSDPSAHSEPKWVRGASKQ